MMKTVKIAKIALSRAKYSYDKLYDYQIPDELKGKIKPGMRVMVPFGVANKDAEGMVVELAEAGEHTGPRAGAHPGESRSHKVVLDGDS